MYTQTLELLIQRNEQHLGMYCSVSFHWNGHDLSLGFPLQTKKVKAPTFLLSLRLSQEKKSLIIYLDSAVCQHYADNRSLNVDTIFLTPKWLLLRFCLYLTRSVH